MKSFQINGGTMYYWQKSLTSWVKDGHLDVKSIKPKIVTVNDDDRLVLEVFYEYEAKGQHFLDTKGLWCNRILDEDEVEAVKDLGTITDAIMHFGVFLPDDAPKSVVNVLANAVTPDDVISGAEGLPAKDVQLILDGMSKDWKIDSITDGVNTVTPSGEFASFGK